MLVAAAVVALLAASAVLAASWLLSSIVLEPHHDLARQLETIPVHAVRDGEVVLDRTADSARPGVYGLVWDGGRALAHEVVATDADRVTRRISDVEGDLRAGAEVGLSPTAYAGDPTTSRDLQHRDVRIPTQLGPAPAWLVPGEGDTWAIFVHGLDGSRADGLGPLPALHRAGLPTLLISYRNDEGAPPAPDGKIHLGQTEWRDLHAAARWALDHGAKRLVLYGASMGGAIVTRFMRASPLADRVDALVLDAPALDWHSIIGYVAGERNVGALATPVRWMMARRIPIDWDAIDEIAHARDFTVPILLFHGLDDEVIPHADSERFARARPGLVDFVGVAHAGHVESWNVDPSAYERRVEAFLGEHAAPRAALTSRRR